MSQLVARLVVESYPAELGLFALLELVPIVVVFVGIFVVA